MGRGGEPHLVTPDSCRVHDAAPVPRSERPGDVLTPPRPNGLASGEGETRSAVAGVAGQAIVGMHWGPPHATGSDAPRAAMAPSVGEEVHEAAEGREGPVALAVSVPSKLGISIYEDLPPHGHSSPQGEHSSRASMQSGTSLLEEVSGWRTCDMR